MDSLIFLYEITRGLNRIILANLMKDTISKKENKKIRLDNYNGIDNH